MKARLILEDGTTFDAQSFGYDGATEGEVVFCTAMTGYPESLTDPSYAGQLLVMTYPLIGNYGVPSGELEDAIQSQQTEQLLPKFWESCHIHAKALIVADYSTAYSHWNAHESLADWLKREHIPGITGIDTRRLTKILREKGVMKGKIITPFESVSESEESDYASTNWVERVSCHEVIRYNQGARRKVVLVDCGVKANIIRCLINRDVEVIRVPWNYDYTHLDFDGLFLSNGPGDPNRCGEAIDILKRFMAQTNKPIFGICLGNQLLAKAAGASIYKLKYGHRSHNQPVQLVGSYRCFITPQNHGYAVDAKTLPKDWKEQFINMNDGSNEGIRHISKPWFSAQFHPEGCSGPTDTEFLFDEFIAKL